MGRTNTAVKTERVTVQSAAANFVRPLILPILVKSMLLVLSSPAR